MRIGLDESKLKKTLDLIIAGKAEADKKQVLAYISGLEKAVKEESKSKRYRTATGARYITGIASEYGRFLEKTKTLVEKEDLKAAAKECAEFAKRLGEEGMIPKPGGLKKKLKKRGINVKFRTKEQAEKFAALAANPMIAIPMIPQLNISIGDTLWLNLLILTFMHLIGRLIQYGLAEEKDKEKYAKWLLIAFAMFAGVLAG